MVVNYFLVTIKIPFIFDYIMLDIICYTITNQLSLIINWSNSKDDKLVNFLCDLVLWLNTLLFEHVVHNRVNNSSCLTPAEIELYWDKSPALRSGFCNKDLVFVEAFSYDFFAKRNININIQLPFSAELNAYLEHVAMELASWVKFIGDLYFITIIVVVFLHYCYELFRKLK